MPSNKALIKQAIDLALELNLEIVTAGLNNAKLADLVSDLKAKKTDAENITSADTPPVEHEAGETGLALMEDAAEVTEPEQALAARKGVFIAEGKALTSKRGILGPGEQIFPEDLAGGKEAIAGFLKTKHLVEVD